jgi:phospholipase C
MSINLAAIENIVVLMFENRSFDHIFGALPGVDGVLLPDGTLKPDLYNVPYPTQPPSPHGSLENPPIPPSPIDTSYQLPHDFNHDFGDGMMPDLFGPGTTGWVDGQAIGAPAITYPATNSGFLTSTVFALKEKPQQGPSALTYFKKGSLKVLHTLAENFVVCDQWHCDMPGHTLPNRCFMHCATTGNVGIADDDSGTILNNTIFQMIEQQGKSWKMYTPLGQLDSWWMNSYMQNSPNAGPLIQEFAQDLLQKSLPFYSFLMCWTSNSPTTDTSMHPKSPIQSGENYLAAVYNALRASPYWEKTLLVVTFDENGGMYDHVVPPAAVQPEPGTPQSIVNHYGTCSTFDYTLLGPRIPALLISPWLAAGVDSTQYQNTSILRFIEDQLAPAQPLSLYLSARDLNATSIAQAFNQFGLPTPRKDCLPSLTGYEKYAWFNGLASGPGPVDPAAEALPPSEHLVEVARMYASGQPGHADSGKPFDRKFATVADLDRYVRQRAQAARWHREGVHENASILVFEKAPQQWTWELMDGNGNLLALPHNTFPTRDLAIEELDKVKFLLHELCCAP